MNKTFIKKDDPELVYLAIPYTWNPDVSFEIVNEVASKLMIQGYVVFSPISQSHVIANHIEEHRLSQEFWQYQDLNLLPKFDKLIVIQIGEQGVELIKNSKGCQSEIRTAMKNNIKIEYLFFKY